MRGTIGGSNQNKLQDYYAALTGAHKDIFYEEEEDSRCATLHLLRGVKKATGGLTH